ncbi:unnamed protein product [Boreogadus saida]
MLLHSFGALPALALALTERPVLVAVSCLGGGGSFAVPGCHLWWRMRATRPRYGPFGEGTPTSSNPKPDHDAAGDDAAETPPPETTQPEKRLRETWPRGTRPRQTTRETSHSGSRSSHAALRTAAPPKGHPRLQQRVEECGPPPIKDMQLT